MMVAVEAYVHDGPCRRLEGVGKAGQRDSASVAVLRGVQSEMFVPPIHYRVPHVRIRWDEHAIPLAVREAIRRLREGEPSIEVRPNTEVGLEMSVWMLQPGETRVVARRLREILQSA